MITNIREMLDPVFNDVLVLKESESKAMREMIYALGPSVHRGSVREAALIALEKANEKIEVLEDRIRELQKKYGEI
jgi:hypothetical protein